MPRRAIIAALAAAGLAACTAGSSPPSLQPRAAERIDPRVPVINPVNARPVSAALAGQLAQLLDEARSGDAAFRPLAERADPLASAAGAPQSESWIVAQEALSAAGAARAPTTRALGDIDALAATALQTQAGIAPSDFAAIRSTASEVAQISSRQAATIDAIQRRLGV
jgi:hypothetical protein